MPLALRICATSSKRLSAYRRKMRPNTGVENSDGLRPVLAQSWSAAAQRRFSTAIRSDAIRRSVGWLRCPPVLPNRVAESALTKKQACVAYQTNQGSHDFHG